MEENILVEQLSAKELCQKLYNKELNTKKNILEYIELTKVLKEESISSDKVQETYNYIYDSIEKMASEIKPNTMMHLKNQLKSQLGKYVKDKDPKKESPFIKFFKEAYPENNRRKDFTWVLMDINKITEEQIWTTLTHINRECLKNHYKLSDEEKVDIIKMVEKIISKNNIKYVNQVKSLEKLLSVLDIKVVNLKEGFKIKTVQKKQ